MEKRLARSLQFQSSFTWAKSIGDADSIIPGLFDSFGAQDECNLRLERGLSIFDVRKRLTFNFVYELPLGRGRPLVNDSPVWTQLLSGWHFSGIVLLQDGMPLNPVYFAFSPANSDTPSRPNIVPGQKLTLPRSQRSPERFFNTDAFLSRHLSPSAMRAETSCRARESICSTWLCTGALSWARRAAWNSVPNFSTPSITPTSAPPEPHPDFGPFFGRIFSVGEPRRIQMALKLNL